MVKIKILSWPRIQTRHRFAAFIVVFVLSINSLLSSFRNLAEERGGKSLFTFDYLSVIIRFQQRSKNRSSDHQQELKRPKQRPTYHALKDLIHNRTVNQTWIYKTSYELATIVNETTSWYQPKKVCRDTCCVETIAISLKQETTKLINWWNDHHELADLRIQHFSNENTNQRYPVFASNFIHHYQDVLPCLVPGTIIAVDNYDKPMNYFWNVVRQQIHIPYVLVTSASDESSPKLPSIFINIEENKDSNIGDDPLLLAWYGTNPRYDSISSVQEMNASTIMNQSFSLIDKFQPILSGLSYSHPQERYIMSYLELTNFSNPFKDMNKWLQWNASTTIDFEKDIFVLFGYKRLKHRRALWNVLCPTPSDSSNNDTSRISCSSNAGNIPLHDLYAEMSEYKFGISPPGKGYDCFRHYEMWMLGIIPIIWERGPYSYDLYENLPVVQMSDMFCNNDNDKNPIPSRTQECPTYTNLTNRTQIIDAIQSYLQSSTFLKNIDSYAKGWKKMFLRYKRQRILHDALRRDQEIIHDEQGREYYQAFRYTSLSRTNDNTGNGMTSNDDGGDDDKAKEQQFTYCYNAKANCAVSNDELKIAESWWNDPTAKQQIDYEWINRWNQLSFKN